MEWVRIGASADFTGRPHPVAVDGVALVVLRPAPGAAPVAFADRCPHRLVPLSAGSFEHGVLRCPYHGWEFDASGRCLVVPSNGPEAKVPPRADLPPGPPLREADGSVWVDRAAVTPPGPLDLLSNVDPGLLRAWHPVALLEELPTTARLLGREWSLSTVDGVVRADPAPYAVGVRWGLVWLAPLEPRTGLFDDPDAEDAAYAGAWLPPSRTGVSAGVVADNFLDVAHFPFVHAATFGAGEERVVGPYDVTERPDGCRSVQVQWFDNPGDPGVAAGLRPVRQRRRATYVHRAPFQLMLRLEELDAGAVKTILFFAQPESAGSTRIYTKMLLHGIGGVADPSPDVVAAEVAFEEAVLAEDLALQARMTVPGLPLRPRDELHVRADRLGVALRRSLIPYRTLS
ncbi:Rieske 2Fe-2S domain-containing protein [Dactylosporangium sp. NPDC005572]|uniref:Rieske 2Fe-2S domain-containing protein n=1 Tax=Dactylosporangium sp. NPDC005572 TaxID=3156889 RepID=UPI0033AA0A64